MDETEIKATWKKLITTFVIGLIALTIAVLFHRLGSKKAIPQTLWFFASAFSAAFTFFSLMKLIRFRKYVKSLGDK